MTYTFALNDSLLPIILIAVICVVLIIVIIILITVLPKKKIISDYSKLKEEYDFSHGNLINDCHSMVTRISTLAQGSSIFEEIYVQRQKQYDDILNKRDKVIADSLTEIETLLNKKDYQHAKQTETSLEISLDDYKKAVNLFAEQLNKELQTDTDTHSASIPAKTKYRSINEFYQNHYEELKPISSSIDVILNKVVDNFKSFDEYTDLAKFEEAKNVLDENEKILDAFLQVYEKLPKLSVSLFSVIPSRLDELNNLYNSLISENYVIDNQILDNINKLVELNTKLQNHLLSLHIANLDEKIEYVDAQITNNFTFLNAEISAKEKFEKSQKELSDQAYGISKRYFDLLNNLNQYESTYVLSNKYVFEIRQLKSEVENVNILERELETYLNTVKKCPYTTINKKTDQLVDGITKCKDIMDGYENYLKTLRKNCEAIYIGLRDCYIKLKQSIVIRDRIAVNSLINMTDSTFISLFDRISQLNNMITVRPIDAEKAMSLFQPLKQDCDELINMINTKDEEANKAEQAIVYANLYRHDYIDAIPYIDRANNAFSEADFDRALNEALTVIKKFKTEDK